LETFYRAKLSPSGACHELKRILNVFMGGSDSTCRLLLRPIPLGADQSEKGKKKEMIEKAIVK
jgi:hypothetical protein